MQVDVSTLYLAGALFSGFVSAVVYFGGGRSSRHNGLPSMAFATAILAVALGLLGLRGDVDEWLTLGLGNTLLAASALLFRFAVDELHGRHERTRVPPFTVGFVWLAEWASFIADTSSAVRAAVGAFGTAAAFLLPVPPLVRGREPWSGKIHYVAGAAFLLGAVASIVRGFAALANIANAPPAASAPSNVFFALAMLGIVAAGAAAVRVMLRQQELARIAMLDGLTGVFNRRAFMDQMKRVLSLAQRRGLACSVVLVDIDHFNRVNHTHGVRAGDEVLRQFVAQARGVLRHEDVLGRSGGGEFAMLLFATPAAGAQAVARRLQSALHARPPRVGGAIIPVTGSFGVSEWHPGYELEGIDLLHRADQALYEAKARGRDCIVCAAI
jgi:diguanylate cyclase (GGDEF)-like protein